MAKQSLDLESQEKRAFFLITFTKELIKNSGEGRILELKKTLEREVREGIRKEGEIGKPPISKLLPSTPSMPISKPLISMPTIPTTSLISKPLRREITPKVIPRPPLKIRPDYVLRIPEPKLPPEFQYLRPVPGERQVDLGKLNPLIKDPAVKTIECNGPEKRIVVIGSMGVKPTNIILNREEIDEIIDKFSEVSKIPIDFGIYKVVIGKLILSAIISDVIGTKFVIKKMMPLPQTRIY